MRPYSLQHRAEIIVLAIAALLVTATAHAGINRWNNGADKWENGINWSLGIPPSAVDSSDVISTGVSIVTIDATTVLSNSINSCLAISNLVVGAPLPLSLGQTNTLTLNNAGLVTPLRTLNSVAINSNGSLSITNSILRVDGLSGGGVDDNGYVLFNTGSMILTNAYLNVGSAGQGNFTMSNGTIQSLFVQVGANNGSQGTFTMAGGTNTLSSYLSLGTFAVSTGTVWMTGGLLIVTNNVIVVGDRSVGKMIVSNGTVLGTTMIVGGSSAGVGSVGTLTSAGGTNILFSNLTVGNRAGSTGTVWLTDGQLIVTNAPTIFSSNGVGQATISNGTWLARDVIVGFAAGSQGTLTIAGGSNNLASLLTIGNLANATGAVWVTSGQLIQTLNPITIGKAGVGQMTVSNGNLQANSVVVAQSAGSRGTLTCAGGTNTAGNLDLGTFAGATGTVWMTGGRFTVSPAPTRIGVFGTGQIIVSNGTLLAGSLSIPDQVGVGAQGTLTIAGGEVSVSDLTMNDPPNGRLFLNSGTLTVVTTFIANGQVFNVGGGNALATLNLGAGSHLFNSGLTIGPTLGSTGAVWTTGFNVDASSALTFVGKSGVGQMTVLDGVVRCTTLFAGANASSVGTLTVAGGTNLISAFLDVGDAVGATGAVWVTSGQLVVTNNSIFVGNAGVGQMTVSNGSVLAQFLDVGALTGSRGTLSVAGGVTTVSSTFAVGLNASTTGAVWMTGGQLVATNGVTFIGSSGAGGMTVSNGAVLVRYMTLGSAAGSQGTLTAVGGTVTVSSNLTVGDCNVGVTGTVIVADGNLFVTNAAHNAVLDVRNGTFVLSSGSVVVDKFVMTNSCGHLVRTGGTLIYGSAVLDPNLDADGDGIPNGYEQSHGFDPLNAADANGDPDGDGLTNLQEFQLGSDPTNNCSPVCMKAIAREGNNIRITWTALGSTTNAVETASQPGGTYSLLAAPIVITGVSLTSTNYVDVGGATNIPARFYRVEVVPGNFASDNAADPAYSSGWTDGSNGGVGFSAWTLAVSNGPNSSVGFYIGSSLSNGDLGAPSIDVTGRSWGMFATNGAVCASRTFSQMQVGQELTLALDNGPVQPECPTSFLPPPVPIPTSFVGFSLNGGCFNTYFDQPRFAFHRCGAVYYIIDANGAYDTGLALTTTGLRLRFTLAAPDSYSFEITDNATGTTNIFSGPLRGAGFIDSVHLINCNAGGSPTNDVYFNSLRLSGIPSP